MKKKTQCKGICKNGLRCTRNSTVHGYCIQHIKLIEGRPSASPMRKQEEYCRRNQVPMFAPPNGICWSCGKKIQDKRFTHITGCDRCQRSFCD